MFKNRLFLLVLCALLALPLLNGTFAAPNNEAAPEKAQVHTEKDLTAITRLTISCITRLHYNAGPLDAKRAQMVFQEYLKQIDPSKMYLTLADIAAFQNDELAPRIASGDLTLVFALYDIVVKRQKEYCDFATALLKNMPKDFLNGKGTYLSDRQKAEWQKTPADLPELWTGRLKNELILQTLSDRAIAHEIETKKAAGQTEGLPEMPRKTVVERVQRRIDQIRQLGRETEKIDITEMFLNALAAVYDPHTSYMSPVTDEDFNISMSLKLSGIGATLTIEDEYIKIVDLIPGGPAEKDGRLQPGDRIIAVAQGDEEAVDVIGMPLQKAVRMIRGAVGTDVVLTVIQAKNGLNSVPVKIRLTRAEVVVKDSEAKGEVRVIKGPDSVERKIGVIELPSFYFDFEAASRGDRNYKCASRDVRNILENFKKQGVDGVIIDLRSNGGGSLADVVTLCGLFIKDGPMVQVRSVGETSSLDDKDGGQVVYDGPLVVMVNRLSASASEIFAGAIRDYGRGIVVGDSKTHGKGTVQTIKHLDPLMPFVAGREIKGGSVKITMAKFYRINGESTQLKGVVPDIIFPSYFDVMSLGEDKLDNPLPWDTIKPAAYTLAPCSSLLENMLPTLRTRSSARVAANPDFQLLSADIARFKRIQDQVNVSLNLEERWTHYLEEKKFAEEQLKLFKLDRDSDEDEKDIYLDECLSIIADMIHFSPAKK